MGFLGEGSFGVVYKAEDKGGQFVCAIKKFLCQNPSTLAKFGSECKLLGSIKHPNIVSCLGVHTNSEGIPLLVMELMEKNLTQFLEESRDSLPMHIQVDTCLQVSYALVHLHTQNIIHRNLNSNNVLLKGSTVKVSDFAVYKLLELTEKPGAEQYRPPEAYHDPPVYTEKFDVFSLGVLIVQVITRERPHPTNRQQAIAAGIFKNVPEKDRRQSEISKIAVSHPMRKLAVQCLADDSEERPSAKEVVTQLNDCQLREQYTASVHKAEAEKATKEALTTWERDNALKEKQEWQSKARALEEVQQQYTELQKQASQSSEQLAQLTQQLQSKEREFEQQVAATQAIERRLQQKVQLLQRSVATQESKLQQKTLEFERKLQDQEQASKGKDEGYRTRLDSISSQCSEWKSKATKLQQVQQQSKHSSEQLAYVRQQLQSTIQELQQQVAATQAMKQGHQQKVQELQQSVASKEGELQKHRDQERVFKGKVEDYRRRVNSLSSDFSNCKSKATALEQQLKQKDEQLRTILSHYNGQLLLTQQSAAVKEKAIQQELAAAKAKEVQLQRKVQEFQESAAAKEKQFQQRQEAFQAKETEYEKKVSALSKVASMATDLEQQLQQKQNQVQKAQEQVRKRDQAFEAFQQHWTEVQEAEMKKGALVSVTGHQCPEQAELSTVTLVGRSFSQIVTWEKKGFRMCIPPGALTESDKCEVILATSIPGDFDLPAGTEPVSAVFRIKSSTDFQKPVTLELEHGCDLTTQRSSKLVFAKSTSKAPPYRFEVVDGGDFPPQSSYGRLTVSRFSLYTILQRIGWGDSRQYRGHVFYQQESPRLWKVVLVVTRKLEQCLEVCRHTVTRSNCMENLLPRKILSAYKLKFISCDCLIQGSCLGITIIIVDTDTAIRPYEYCTLEHHNV